MATELQLRERQTLTNEVQQGQENGQQRENVHLYAEIHANLSNTVEGSENPLKSDLSREELNPRYAGLRKATHSEPHY